MEEVDEKMNEEDMRRDIDRKQRKSPFSLQQQSTLNFQNSFVEQVDAVCPLLRRKPQMLAARSTSMVFAKLRLAHGEQL